MPKACELRIRLRLALPLLIASVVFAAAPLRAQTVQNWKFKILDENDPTAQAGTTNATGINDAGNAVGSFLSGGFYAGFRWTGGTSFTTLIISPSTCNAECNTLPNAINNSGEIVGEYDDPNFLTHGFYSVNGQYNVFDFPAAYYTIATGVSNKGTIAGFYQEYAGAGERDSGYGANVNGFIYTPGKTQPTELNLPGCTETELYGVNDSGTAVGNCPGSFNTVKFYGIAYNPATQVETDLIVQNSQFTHAYGINDVGQIVGAYNDGTTYHCFLYSSGSYIIIPDPPGSTLTICTGINNAAQVAGYFLDAQSQQHGFIATGPVLLDPVPSASDTGLLDGPAVASDAILQSIGFNARVVNGVAADGVTEVVIRVPAKNAGDQFTFTLVNDGNVFSSDPQSDGALGNPGDTTFTQNQVTVSAINVTAADRSQSPYAFAVYRAPVDFVRPPSGGSYLTGTQHYVAYSSGFETPCGGPWPPCFETVNFGSLSPASRTDDQLASRGVTIQIQDVTNGNTFSLPVEILRPPVVMIHGLWDNWKTWNNFNPLVKGDYTVDPRFYIGRVSYDFLANPSGSYPSYSSPSGGSILQEVRANSLGFGYNAPFVLQQINEWIENFKQANNPLGIPVAAVQADIVAHSMGGDITRTILTPPTVDTFLSNDTFGQGDIHKLITIDTPHLGTPLASLLVQPGNAGGCVEKLLAYNGRFVFVNLSFGFRQVDGAIADLATSSPAVLQIASPGPHPLPAALIAGAYVQFGVLDSALGVPSLFRNVCGVTGDPLAGYFTSTNWQAIFQNADNDAIVPVTSQVNNSLGNSNAFLFTGTQGYVHSPGTEKLGFASPSVLDPPDVPNEIIKLLNTSVVQTSFAPLNP